MACMTTRSGTPYHPSQDQPSSSMDTSMETLMKSMIERMDCLDAKFDQFEERVGTLEESRLTPTEPPSPRLPLVHPRTQR